MSADRRRQLGPRQVYRLFMRLWCQFGVACLAAGRQHDAFACLRNADAVASLAQDPVPRAMSIYLAAMLHESSGDRVTAEAQYSSALAVHASHAPSLIRLAALALQAAELKLLDAMPGRGAPEDDGRHHGAAGGASTLTPKRSSRRMLRRPSESSMSGATALEAGAPVLFSSAVSTPLSEEDDDDDALGEEDGPEGKDVAVSDTGTTSDAHSRHHGRRRHRTRGGGSHGQVRGVYAPGPPPTPASSLDIDVGEHLDRAEQLVQRALQIDALSYHAWHLLGRIRAARGQHKAAATAVLTSLELETASPLISLRVAPLAV